MREIVCRTGAAIRVDAKGRTMKPKAEIPAKHPITYMVGPDGELYPVDSSGQWCDELEDEAN
jgi:hypothetical protein